MVGRSAALPEALLAVGFPSVLQGKEYMVEAWKEFSYQCQGLRRTGSSAINMAYVAAGRLEGFFAHEICPWDIAGGMVLVEEAGGTVTNPQGARYEPLSGESLGASNGPLQAEMLKTLNRVLPGDAR